MKRSFHSSDSKSHGMRVPRKYMVLAGMGMAVFIGISAFSPPGNEYRNLKVLPRNISTKDLSRIMIDEFEDGLGVSCGFCHKKQKDSEKLDYASDEKPEKEIARMMMKMSLAINRKYFGVRHPQIGDSTMVITCNTCHNGRPFPGSTD